MIARTRHMPRCSSIFLALLAASASVTRAQSSGKSPVDIPDISFTTILPYLAAALGALILIAILVYNFRKRCTRPSGGAYQERRLKTRGMRAQQQNLSLVRTRDLPLPPTPRQQPQTRPSMAQSDTGREWMEYNDRSAMYPHPKTVVSTYNPPSVVPSMYTPRPPSQSSQHTEFFGGNIVASPMTLSTYPEFPNRTVPTQIASVYPPADYSSRPVTQFSIDQFQPMSVVPSQPSPFRPVLHNLVIPPPPTSSVIVPTTPGSNSARTPTGGVDYFIPSLTGSNPTRTPPFPATVATPTRTPPPDHFPPTSITPTRTPPPEFFGNRGSSLLRNDPFAPSRPIVTLDSHNPAMTTLAPLPDTNPDFDTFRPAPKTPPATVELATQKSQRSPRSPSSQSGFDVFGSGSMNAQQQQPRRSSQAPMPPSFNEFMQGNGSPAQRTKGNW
ncbi:hypothetical protein BJ742DRAFT_827680 [Cladochytrium replicatum]|nr:hypothetical protein BJ742DRAFT_827680 [Cladochytrium replicatum]